ncbi:GtrA family protein [Corynebacterium confusum]|uniref:GtrA family protein n=1 Tax=Corynebacterium confusum TaxID=71254 RepID=UPI0025B60D0B|nr:GtrA family protein [Corynebacterium confusum]
MGVVGAAIDFGTVHFLETSGANALISRAISYILGSLFAYYGNSVVTFSGNRSTTEKLRAFIVYTACLIMAVLVNKLARIPLANFEHTVFLSWVISQATATTLNFILQSKSVFTSENTSRSAHSAPSGPCLVSDNPASTPHPARQGRVGEGLSG